MHLPGHAEYDPHRKVQHLEKRYFEVGNLGFPVIRAPMGSVPGINMGMMICNDRRWPEAWRVLGLQSVELVMLGYNTPSLNMEAGGFEAHHLRVFHSHLSIQAGCYQNACFAVATAKAGIEDGCELFGHSIIVNPQGEIIAMATSWDDELITADCNLDMCTLGRTTIFAFDKHRRPEAYHADHRAGGRGGTAGVAEAGGGVARFAGRPDIPPPPDPLPRPPPTPPSLGGRGTLCQRCSAAARPPPAAAVRDAPPRPLGRIRPQSGPGGSRSPRAPTRDLRHALARRSRWCR